MENKDEIVNLEAAARVLSEFNSLKGRINLFIGSSSKDYSTWREKRENFYKKLSQDQRASRGIYSFLENNG